MTRRYYRLALTVLCSLAACAGPVFFLEDRARLEYLLGGLVAALLTWGLLTFAMAMEGSLRPGLLAILGLGAGILSWVPITVVMFFKILPHIFQGGYDPFDPVWVMAGFSPLAVLTVALWRHRADHIGAVRALSSTLYRYSVPLFALQLAVAGMGLSKQFRWLFLFTGVMFLVVDGLGAGDELPLLAAAGKPRQHEE